MAKDKISKLLGLSTLQGSKHNTARDRPCLRVQDWRITARSWVTRPDETQFLGFTVPVHKAKLLLAKKTQSLWASLGSLSLPRIK